MLYVKTSKRLMCDFGKCILYFLSITDFKHWLAWLMNVDHLEHYCTHLNFTGLY